MPTALEEYVNQNFAAQHMLGDAAELNTLKALSGEKDPLIKGLGATLTRVYGYIMDQEKRIKTLSAGHDGKSHDGGKDGSVGSSNLNRRLMDEAVGDMYVYVIRNTNNIKVGGIAPNLPFCLFGINDFDNKYATLMGPQLSALQASFPGIVLTSVLPGPAGTVQFTYTLGASSDVITIGFTGNATAYSNALNAQNQDKLKWGTRFILYTISDWTNGLSQMQNGFLNFSKIGINNNLEQNIISVDSRILSDFFRYDRVEMVFPCQAMSADAGIVDTIIPVPSEDTFFQIKYNIFNAYKGRHIPAQYKAFVEKEYGHAA